MNNELSNAEVFDRLDSDGHDFGPPPPQTPYRACDRCGHLSRWIDVERIGGKDVCGGCRQLTAPPFAPLT